MKTRDDIWQPSEGINALMYRYKITPDELKEAIIECWDWFFGEDIVFRKLLYSKFEEELLNQENIQKGTLIRIINYFESVIKKFKNDEACKNSIIKLRYLAGMCFEADMKAKTILITEEDSIVDARNRGLQMAKSIGFSQTDSVKIATAISELTRNILNYAGHGTIEIIPMVRRGKRAIKIVATDEGPGIDNVNDIMDGQYKSSQGLGIGLLGTKRLTDDFSIETMKNRGTKITAVKYL